MRLWVWESPRADGPKGSIDTHMAEPMPYPRTGPGLARDGKPKFDLGKFNQAYFDRLRERVSAARERDIYVSVMLFQGWSVRNFQRGRQVFIYHPYFSDNNINGISGDVNGNGEGEELNSLDRPELTRLQEAYIRKVVDTLNDLDNVLYEVSNESHLPQKTGGYPPSSKDWQFHVIRFVKQYEKSKPRQHPVGMGGHNPILMEWMELLTDRSSGLEAARRAMGHTREFAERIDLAHMTPRDALASTGYCLANPGVEYFVYQPVAGSFTVKLALGSYQYEWFNPASGKVAGKRTITATKQPAAFMPPFAGDAALYVLSSE